MLPAFIGGGGTLENTSVRGASRSIVPPQDGIALSRLHGGFCRRHNSGDSHAAHGFSIDDDLPCWLARIPTRGCSSGRCACRGHDRAYFLRRSCPQIRAGDPRPSANRQVETVTSGSSLTPLVADRLTGPCLCLSLAQ